MAGENDDIRTALSDAFDKVEGSGEAAEAPPSTAAPAESPPPSPEDAAPSTPIGGGKRERDPETGKFVKTDEVAEAPKEPPKEPAKAQEATPAAPKPPSQPQFAKEGARAPQSWRPAVREKFGSLPPEVQEEAIRLDREVRRTMQESATARREAQQYREIFAPVEPTLRAMNSDPIAFTRDAVLTAQALASGPQPVKAQAIARLIQIYGVDIPTLDSVLTPMLQGGQIAGVVPQAQQPMYDPRVTDLLSTIDRARQQSAAEEDQEAANIIDESGVEQAEFFEDLREDMADLLDMAANRGIAMTPQQAYDKAALLNPDISRIIQQRAEFEAVKGGSPAAARARLAASSPRSSPEVPKPPTQPDTMRDAIVAAWDLHVK